MPSLVVFMEIFFFSFFFGGQCHSFLFYFFLIQAHIITFTDPYIHRHSPRSVSRCLHCCFAQLDKLPWGAEPGFELKLALQQASALLNELRCTLKRYSYSKIKNLICRNNSWGVIFSLSNLSSWEVYYTPFNEFLQDSLFKGQGSLLNFHDRLLWSNSDSPYK